MSWRLITCTGFHEIRRLKQIRIFNRYIYNIDIYKHCDDYFSPILQTSQELTPGLVHNESVYSDGII